MTAEESPSEHDASAAGRRRRICLAVLAAVTMAVVLVAVTADGPDAISGGLGGDYPSFHAAGDIARDDPGLSADRFYDPAIQAEAQVPYRADDDGQLFFAYPTFFVTPYMAISSLGFTLGYVVHTALMAAALAAALRILRPCSRVAREWPLEAFTAAITFFPLFRGVTGGQNTALTLLLTAVVWRSMHDDRDGLAGVAVALLLFKPPFALPFLGALVLARRWRALGAASATAVVLYGIGASVTDPGWPSAWVDAIRFLDEFDTPFNVQNFVSIPGFAEAIFGIDDGVGLAVGYGLAAIVAIAVVVSWLHTPAGRGRLAMGPLVVTTAIAAVAMSPHALYYDAGLLVLVALVLLERDARHRTIVLVGWFGGLLHLLADSIGADPLTFVVLAGVLAAFRAAWSNDAPRVPQSSV